MNRDFLGHDYLTDIITFDLGDIMSPVQGEIYISLDRIRDNAKKFKCTFAEEMHRVIIHGVLHLLGHGDKGKVEKARMKEKEDACLSLLHVSRGTMKRRAKLMFHVEQ